MSIKKQRVHFAAFVWFRYASLLANILRKVKENTVSTKRSCQDMYGIFGFLRTSIIAEEPSIKDKMKLSLEYFDSEASIK